MSTTPDPAPPTVLTEDEREGLAAVLREHRYLANNLGDKTGCRGCRWTFSWRGERGRRAHESHVADLLADRVAAAVQAEGDRVVIWAVEITWADHEKAGAAGPTSLIEPFRSKEHALSFIDNSCLRDRAVVAYRLLKAAERRTPWSGADEATVISDADRKASYDRLRAEMAQP